MTIDLLAQPLRLPCGAVLPNRICKAAMTEGIADPRLRATEEHVRLYRTWAQGGAGLLISGNVMIDRRVLERPAPANPTRFGSATSGSLQPRWSCRRRSAGLDQRL